MENSTKAVAEHVLGEHLSFFKVDIAMFFDLGALT